MICTSIYSTMNNLMTLKMSNWTQLQSAMHKVELNIVQYVRTYRNISMWAGSWDFSEYSSSKTRLTKDTWMCFNARFGHFCLSKSGTGWPCYRWIGQSQRRFSLFSLQYHLCTNTPSIYLLSVNAALDLPEMQQTADAARRKSFTLSKHWPAV